MERLPIVEVPISSLVDDPENPRAHDDRNVDAIRNSIVRFGQVEPLVVQKSSRMVIAGNGRLGVLRSLGWDRVSVVELDVDDRQARALSIALNRSGELASWNDGVLAKHLQSLGQLDASLPIELGFDVDDLQKLSKLETVRETGGIVGSGGNAEAGDNDEGPVAPKADASKIVTRKGDVWGLESGGDDRGHRLMCGSSTDVEDMKTLMDGNIAKLWSTDPPYCVDYTGADRPIHNGRSSGKDWSDLYNEVDIKDLGAFLDDVAKCALPHLVDDAAVYMWHAHLQQPTIAAVFERHGILLHQVLVWVKPVATFGHSYYRWKHEPCAFGWRQGYRPKHGQGQMESVWFVDWEGKSRVVGNEYPTQKPTKLFEIPMEVHTKVGDICLETFSGSGSQIMAGEKLGRRVFAMELSPGFVDADIRRWQKATGNDAKLLRPGDPVGVATPGMTYAQVAQARGVSLE